MITSHLLLDCLLCDDSMACQCKCWSFFPAAWNTSWSTDHRGFCPWITAASGTLSNGWKCRCTTAPAELRTSENRACRTRCTIHRIRLYYAISCHSLAWLPVHLKIALYLVLFLKCRVNIVQRCSRWYVHRAGYDVCEVPRMYGTAYYRVRPGFWWFVSKYRGGPCRKCEECLSFRNSSSKVQLDITLTWFSHIENAYLPTRHVLCRYKPKMLMDFIKMNVQKLNIPKLIHACERPAASPQTIEFFHVLFVAVKALSLGACSLPLHTLWWVRPSSKHHDGTVLSACTSDTIEDRLTWDSQDTNLGKKLKIKDVNVGGTDVY